MRQHHHGLIIKEGRKKLRMTQSKLAEVWPQSNGGTRSRRFAKQIYTNHPGVPIVKDFYEVVHGGTR